MRETVRPTTVIPCFGWFAGALDPVTGKITRYPLPADVRDPHTLIFDKAGNIWFTAQSANYVGHLVTKTGQVHLIKSPTPGSQPMPR